MVLGHLTIPRLAIHDDAELAALLGEAVLTRETIREWPLSWTQRIELVDGRTFAYKSQLPPLVESEFYASAESPLLPGHKVLGRLGDCSTVLIDWIDAPSLADTNLSKAETLTHAAEVVRQISTISGDPPTYLDVGTSEKWSEEADLTLGKLRRLIADGTFNSMTPAMVDKIEAWTVTPEVTNQISSSSRLVHRDLKLDHIFITDDGYRVIDWQVPVIAPGDVDLAMLLADAGIDPRSYVDQTTCGISHFLALRWAVVAQHDFFPERAWPLFERWAFEAMRAILR